MINPSTSTIVYIPKDKLKLSTYFLIHILTFARIFTAHFQTNFYTLNFYENFL